MNRKRTLEEIERSQYVSKAEIGRLLGVGRTTACRIYNAAEQIDIAELGKNRVMDTRVRIRSVYEVLGTKKKAASKLPGRMSI